MVALTSKQRSILCEVAAGDEAVCRVYPITIMELCDAGLIVKNCDGYSLTSRGYEAWMHPPIPIINPTFLESCAFLIAELDRVSREVTLVGVGVSLMRSRLIWAIWFFTLGIVIEHSGLSAWMW